MNKNIILASGSPRRIEMLRQAGFFPVIIPSSVDENLPLEMTMEQSVMYLALKKALDVNHKIENKYFELNNLESQPSDFDNSVIIAADTVVYKNGIIGKPADFDDGYKTLSLLKNTNHYVCTGVAFIDTETGLKSVFYETTEVFFDNYKDEEIIEYLNSEEPWDKAGSYAIQGKWGIHVKKYIGDYNNVIGFPLDRILLELENFSS